MAPHTTHGCQGAGPCVVHCPFIKLSYIAQCGSVICFLLGP